MTDKYIPQVGDPVRRADWGPAMVTVRVTAVGKSSFLASSTHAELVYSLVGSWVKVPETKTWMTATERRPIQDGEYGLTPSGIIYQHHGPTSDCDYDVITNVVEVES